VAPVFKLADLIKLYSRRLEQLGLPNEGRPHSTKLKNRILSHFPYMTAHRQGRDILLAFDEDIGSALRKACEIEDYDEEAICWSRAAKIVRRDMNDLQIKFSGSFEPECQLNSVPQSLLSIVAMIHGGSNIASQSPDGVNQETLSMAQLLMFNSARQKRERNINVYHSKIREPPLPIYVGLTVHARTRKRDLIDTLFDLGLSISYTRVMEISTTMGNVVCAQYHSEQVVCPPNLRRGLFTVAAVDNIDHNPSSSTATGSFHGTGISLFQFQTPSNLGTTRSYTLELESSSKKLNELPDSYTNVGPLNMSKAEFTVPHVDGKVTSDCQNVIQELQKETQYVSHKTFQFSFGMEFFIGKY